MEWVWPGCSLYHGANGIVGRTPSPFLKVSRFLLYSIPKASYDAERFPEIIPGVPTTKKSYNRNWYLVHFSDFLCQVLVPSSLPLSPCSYPKVPRDPFIAALLPKRGFRAIAIQALVNYDSQDEFHLHVLSYWQWGMHISHHCAIEAILHA